MSVGLFDQDKSMNRKSRGAHSLGPAAAGCG